MAERRNSPSMLPSSRVRFGGSFTVALLLHGSVAAALMTTRDRGPQVESVPVVFDFATPAPEPAPPPLPEPEALPIAQPEVEDKPEPPQKPPPVTPKRNRRRAITPRPESEETPPKPGPVLDQNKPSGGGKNLLAEGGGGWVDDSGHGAGQGGDGVSPRPVTPAPPAPPAPPKVQPLVAPTALSGNTSPRYALGAKLAGVQGTVVISFEVLEDGRVGNAKIVSGPDELHEAVLHAVAGWRFKPAHRGGTPVRVRKRQSFVFRLEEG